MTYRIAACAVVGCALILTSAHAALDTPKLPPSAKKLNAREILALYGGSPIAFTNYSRKELITGTVSYDFKAKTFKGSYTVGDNSGQFSGRIRLKGDLLCHTIGQSDETCVSVYSDGADTYEVTAKGAVDSRTHKQ